jgi:aspartyl-tRNA(Asn)/glutamyl-tRNA(Gln) amidotransferase subunit A
MRRDWSAAPLTATADAIAQGKTKSRDVVEACLDRYHSAGKMLGCFIEIDEANVLRSADEADRFVRSGAPVGKLHGIPLAHKDLFYRCGRISACGSKLRSDFHPTETATVLQRLDAAGALEIGRLLMVEFALGPHGHNPNYPQCRNPWSIEHIPSGSSSGSGVAVAARMIHGSLGSDTGGSIRGPATVSGVVGLMPTHGRVSCFGTMPLSHSLDVIGPLTRTVRDAARILDVIAGHDARDQTTFDLPEDHFEAALDQPAPLPRIGIARGYFDDDLHPEVAHAFNQAIAAFAAFGVDIVDVTIDRAIMSEVAELQPLVMKSEAAAHHVATMQGREDDYSIEVAQRLQAGYFLPASDYLLALKARSVYLREAVRMFFKSADVLLTPTICIPVPTIAETTGKRGKNYMEMVAALTRNTKVLNYLGLPVLNVPCGFTAKGLPTAFQIVGRPFDEIGLLRAGNLYQKQTDWHRREPPFA